MAGRTYNRIIIDPKSQKGYIARLRIKSPDGTERNIDRVAESRKHANQILDDLELEFLSGGSELVDAGKMTFRELAARYCKDKVIEAVYVGERKVSGLKKPQATRNRVNNLSKYFGQWPINKITNQDLLNYKDWLIKTPTRYKKPRGIYDINHQLRQLRIIFNYAIRKGWLRVNPFNVGEQVFSAADELPRERAEIPGELDRLLRVCTGRRAHLRIYILLAIDTALRPEERLRIQVSDIDFEKKIIVARASNTKVNRRRLVPISDRLVAELHEWLREGLRQWVTFSPAHSKEERDDILSNPEMTIFAGIKSINKGWTGALQEAGITDLQPRDLRHWATTEIAQAIAAAGGDRAHAMRITGHSQEKTFRRYITTDLDIVQNAGDALENLRQMKKAAAQAEEKKRRPD